MENFPWELYVVPTKQNHLVQLLKLPPRCVALKHIASGPSTAFLDPLRAPYSGAKKYDSMIFLNVTPGNVSLSTRCV